MDFWMNVIQTVVKAVFIAAVAYGGVLCGKNLRVRKNAKKELEAAIVDGE